MSFCARPFRDSINFVNANPALYAVPGTLDPISVWLRDWSCGLLSSPGFDILEMG